MTKILKLTMLEWFNSLAYSRPAHACQFDLNHHRPWRNGIGQVEGQVWHHKVVWGVTFDGYYVITFAKVHGALDGSRRTDRRAQSIQTIFINHIISHISVTTFWTFVVLAYQIILKL